MIVILGKDRFETKFINQNNMTRSILRTVLVGIFIGAAAFFVPKLLIGIFIFCAIIHLFHCGRRRHGYCGHGHYGHQRMFYLADKIRKMSEEEYAEFKTNMGGGCYDHGYHEHCGCGSKSANKDCCKSKKEETTK